MYDIWLVSLMIDDRKMKWGIDESIVLGFQPRLHFAWKATFRQLSTPSNLRHLKRRIFQFSRDSLRNLNDALKEFQRKINRIVWKLTAKFLIVEPNYRNETMKKLWRELLEIRKERARLCMKVKGAISREWN